MRIRSATIAILLMAALLLSACAGGNDQGANGTGVPGATDTGTQVSIPDTGQGTPTQGLETDTAAVPTMVGTEATTPTVEETTSPTQAAGGGAQTTATVDQTRQPSGGQGNTGVIGIPNTSGGLVGLAAMMNWKVVGADGNEIGTVQDYVVNMCEAHILYLVVDPAAGVTVENDQQLLIPYEAVLGELNEGSSVDVQQGVFTLKGGAADLSGVPGVDMQTADLENPAWSEQAFTYWKKNYRISLTAACNVPVSSGQGAAGSATQPGPTNTPNASETAAPTAAATATLATNVTATPTTANNAGQGTNRQRIFRLALASKLFGAALQEGNGTPLGTVRDVAIVPETGRTQFVIVEVTGSGQTSDASGRLVALPPGAVNVSYEATPGQPVLVLLVDTAVLQSAPDFDPNMTMTDENWSKYWSQYVPLTREQQQQQQP